MQFLYKADAFAGRHMALIALCCVCAGIAFPHVFSGLAAANVCLFAFMTFANSLGGGFHEMGIVLRRPLPVAAVLLLLHVVMPLLALGVGTLLFPNAPLFTTGLILEYAIPTAVASLMWVGIGRGNTSLCLAIVLLDTLLSPIMVPLTLRLLVGSVVQMDTVGMMKNLAVMVAIPALAAMVLYQITRGRTAETLKPRLAPFAKLSLYLIIVTNATGCAPFLRHITPTLILVMLATFFLCLSGYFLGYWTGRLLKLDFSTVETLTLTGGMRNISAGAVLASRYFPGDVLFPVAFSPLFLQVTAALVIRILHRTRIGRMAQESEDRTSPPVK